VINVHVAWRFALGAICRCGSSAIVCGTFGESIALRAGDGTAIAGASEVGAKTNRKNKKTWPPQARKCACVCVYVCVVCMSMQCM